ncbi:MAG: hypothetical protein ACPIOQ_34850, partial [Promethearchaeia archaeon]
GGAALLQRAHILEKQDRQRCGHCEEAKCMRQSLPPHHALQESPQRLPPATSVLSRATDLSPRGTGANSMLPLVETQGDRVRRLGRSHLHRMTCTSALHALSSQPHRNAPEENTPTPKLEARARSRHSSSKGGARESMHGG